MNNLTKAGVILTGIGGMLYSLWLMVYGIKEL